MMDMPICEDATSPSKKCTQDLNQERSLPNVVMLCVCFNQAVSTTCVLALFIFFFFQLEDRKKKKDILSPATRGNLFATPANAGGRAAPPPSKKLKRKKMLRCEMGECRKRYDFRLSTPDFRLRDFLFTQPAQHGRRPSERPEPSATKASAGESVREEEPCLRGAARRVDWARDERGTEAGDLGGRL